MNNYEVHYAGEDPGLGSAPMRALTGDRDMSMSIDDVIKSMRTCSVQPANARKRQKLTNALNRKHWRANQNEVVNINML